MKPSKNRTNLLDQTGFDENPIVDVRVTGQSNAAAFCGDQQHINSCRECLETTTTKV